MKAEDMNRAESDSELRITAPQTAAAGPEAVISSARHGVREMGLVRSMRALRRVNQKGGFDCPGCAWPEPESASPAEFCENGVKAVAAAATTARITAPFFAEWGIDALRRKSDYWLGQQGRLTAPMLLPEGKRHYEPVSWDQAIARLAARLRALSSPDEAVFYSSGRASNEAAFLFQLFVRIFGTNNLPDCSNMCHESSGMGLKQVIGVGKGTVTLQDFERAELIFVIGQNPGTNHPRMLSTLERAVRAGARIVHVNPLPEAGLIRFRHPQKLAGYTGRGTPLASVFAQVRIGGDIAFLNAVMKRLFEEEERRPSDVLDRAFIAEHTDGFEDFRRSLDDASVEDLADSAGISTETVRQVAQLVMDSRRIIVCWAMGLTQHEHAIANVQSIVNLLLLKGSIGKPGAGVCPVRGHSNVQGDRTVGITPRPSTDFLDRLGKRFGFDPPRAPGYDTVDAIRAMHEGKVRVFTALGGNFLSAAPDTAYTADALGRCDMTVHVSTKLNRSHLTPGREALILPCLARTEQDRQQGSAQFVSVENSMGVVHSSRGHMAPASERLRSEVAIVASLAGKTLREREPWESFAGDYDLVREAIGDVVPGFEDYNARIRLRGGFVLPNAARDGRFDTPSGKARFTVHEVPALAVASGQYIMMTIRSHDQFNTTVYGLDDRYRGIRGGRRVVMLHPQDVADAGLREGQCVTLVSVYGGVLRRAEGFAVVPYPLPRRCAATYFPEANVLVPVDHTARGSNTPASKSVIIRLEPCEMPA